MPKAYVLLSGGIDSSTALAMANADWDGRVCGVSVSYGQRHTNEIQHASMVAKAFANEYRILELGNIIQKGGLTDQELVIPHKSYDELPEGVSPTYVPFRNGTMLSCITGMAAVDPEAEAVYIGVHAEDAQNWAYPDCTPEFIGGMANAIYIGTYHKVRLLAPLLYMKKHEIVREGDRLGVPWDLTWSCYEGGEEHCGICPTCRARQEAFTLASISDPTIYSEYAGETS